MALNAAASKYVLTTTPPLPSLCIGCRKSADGKTTFVDPNASEDYYGAIVFCMDCAKEVAVLIGYIPKENTIKLEDTIRYLQSEAQIAHEKVEALEAVVRSYFLPDSNPYLADSDPVSDVEADSAEGQGDSVSEESEPGLFE